MKLQLSTLTLIVLVSFFAIGNEHPPVSWWAAPQSIEEIEAENKDYIAEQTAQWSKYHHECTKIKSGSPVSTKSTERIQRYDTEDLVTTPCSNEQLKLNENPVYSLELHGNIGWVKLKSILEEGDEVRRYAAPPLSGGFGFMVVRSGKVVHVFEQGVQ